MSKQMSARNLAHSLFLVKRSKAKEWQIVSVCVCVRDIIECKLSESVYVNMN